MLFCRDILEELEDMIEEKQLHELNEMELFFFHFKAQDLDENNKLDGVEYYHAIYNHYASEFIIDVMYTFK